MQVVIRLLCLASIVAGGIKAKTLENIKKEFLQVCCFLPRGHDTLMAAQAYGYSNLPLLLSLATPPLAILLPNPLPSSAPATLSSAKYPYTSLRKSLRLLIDGDDSLDELENDISYVYSGYAPISIRLVQCVAQKGGVLSNPAKSKEGATEEDGKKGQSSLLGPTRAHPIVGFKGFEDVVQSIAGRSFDIKQKGAEVTNGSTTLRKWLNRSRDHTVVQKGHFCLVPASGERTTITVVFFLGGCTYTEIAALRWAGCQTQGKLVIC